MKTSGNRVRVTVNLFLPLAIFTFQKCGTRKIVYWQRLRFRKLIYYLVLAEHVAFQLYFTLTSVLILLTDCNTFRSVPVWRIWFNSTSTKSLVYFTIFSTTRNQILEEIAFVALMIFHILTSFLLSDALMMYGENRSFKITHFA